MKILTYGKFDNLHRGHIQFLKKAKSIGDCLIVALQTDDLADNFDKRKNTLLRTGIVDDVKSVKTLDSCMEIIEKENINIYVYGNENNKIHPKCDVKYISSDIINIAFLVVCIGQACTLRCKNCGNFVVYAPKHTKIYPISRIIDDLRMIINIADINLLQIQGGEPFIHPELGKLVQFITETDAIAKCEIATNGTVKPNIDLELLKHKKMSIRISNYQIVQNDSEKLKLHLETNGVKYSIYNFVSKKAVWNDLGYTPPLSPTAELADDNTCKTRFENCAFRGCLTLEQSKLGYCSRSIIAEAVQGFVAKPSDYLILRSPSPPSKKFFFEQFKNYIENRHFMEACRYCNGTATGKFIEPAIQL